MVFLAYAAFGPYFPGLLQHAGNNWPQIVNHMYLTSQGIYGVAVGVVATYVFHFVLFGVLATRIGLGQLFLDVASTIAGRYAGGPAKVSVFGSAMFGMLSGSSVANAVTVGSLTIPAMIRIGYPRHFAAGVEAASSTGGQITPPIMGAAAFLMIEFLGIPYQQIAIAGIFPAFLYFFGMFMQVHFEAKREGLRGLTEEEMPAPQGFVQEALADAAAPDHADRRAGQRPHAVPGGVCRHHGLHRGGPAQPHAAAAPARPLRSLRDRRQVRAGGGCGSGHRGPGDRCGHADRRGLQDLVHRDLGRPGHRGRRRHDHPRRGRQHANPDADRRAGHDRHRVHPDGLRHSTTANYIIMVAVAAPTLVQLGVQPIAAHFFVFYFGILADITPPVALGIYAAAGMAGSDPFKTGNTAFRLGIPKLIVPSWFSEAAHENVHSSDR